MATCALSGGHCGSHKVYLQGIRLLRAVSLAELESECQCKRLAVSLSNVLEEEEEEASEE